MKRIVTRLLLLALVVALTYCVWLGFRVWSQSHVDEVHSADAIVVLGAAQYNGRPSPVFAARLDHALYLYNQDLSDVIITTGGKQPGDNFTESQAGQDYLESHGVPASGLLGEDEGRTTYGSLVNVAGIAESEGIDSVLLVSDPLHSERLKIMASDLGLESYASPASYTQLARSRETKVQELLHEVASLLAYELHLDR